jgi:hypothetical protein
MEIFAAQGAPLMTLTPVANGKNSITKVLIVLFGHLWEVGLTYRYIFAFEFTLRSQQPDIVPIICHLFHWHRRQILSPVSTTLAKLVAKFAAGVVDTGGAP